MLPSSFIISQITRAKGEHVSRPRQIRRLGDGINGHLNCAGAIVSRDAGGDALAGVDGLAEGRAILRSVLGGHGADPQMLEALFGHSEADETATILSHEVDGLWRDFLGSQGKVTFVLAVFVINDHDHPTGPDFLNGVGDVGEWGLGAHIEAILAEACTQRLRFFA
jgi:hypothetical protein